MMKQDKHLQTIKLNGLSLIVDEDKSKYVDSFMHWYYIAGENLAIRTSEKLQKSWIIWRDLIMTSKENSIRLNALTILRNSNPLKRSTEQISYLKEMCRHFGFTGPLPEAAMTKFCQNIELQTYEDNEVIFLQGENTESERKYFMQLDGKIEFFIYSGDDRKLLRECSVDKREGLSSDEIREKLGKKKFVRLKGPFGDTALVTGKPRSLSAIVSGGANVMTCSRETYRSCILFHQSERLNVEINAKIRFLKSMSMVRAWNLSEITRLAHDIGKQDFGVDQVVLRQGHEVSKIAIVAEGEVVLEKEAPHQDSPTGKVASGQASPTRVTTILPGTMLGDIEAFYGKTTYIYTARVSNKGPLTVYWISLDKFHAHFMNGKQETRSFVEDSVYTRKKHYKHEWLKSAHSADSLDSHPDHLLFKQNRRATKEQDPFEQHFFQNHQSDFIRKASFNSPRLPAMLERSMHASYSRSTLSPVGGDTMPPLKLDSPGGSSKGRWHGVVRSDSSFRRRGSSDSVQSLSSTASRKSPERVNVKHLLGTTATVKDRRSKSPGSLRDQERERVERLRQQERAKQKEQAMLMAGMPVTSTSEAKERWGQGAQLPLQMSWGQPSPSNRGWGSVSGPRLSELSESLPDLRQSRSNSSFQLTRMEEKTRNLLNKPRLLVNVHQFADTAIQLSPKQPPYALTKSSSITHSLAKTSNIEPQEQGKGAPFV